MFERVGQRLLHNAIGAELEARRELARIPVTSTSDHDAATAHLFGELTQVAQAARRLAVAAIAGVAQHPEQARSSAIAWRPCCSVDRSVALASAGSASTSWRRRRHGRHHGHRMRNDVVQLARQAGALLHGGQASAFLALGRELLGQLLEQLRPSAQRPDARAGRPR